MSFPAYPKTPRFNMGCLVTEKIDGTNALLEVIPLLEGDEKPQHGIQVGSNYVRAGSRTRWISPGNDNFGFAGFVHANAEWLAENLGPGLHYGEWYGQGIQRNYGLLGRRLALFDGPGRYPFVLAEGPWEEEPVVTRDVDRVTRYVDLEGGSVGVVPLLYQGPLDEVLDGFTVVPEHRDAHFRIKFLRNGSKAVPGFENTEGVIVQLRGSGGGQRFKIVWGK